MRPNPDNAPEKKKEYREKLPRMTEEELYNETKDKLWFSGYASNNPRSCFHWQCDYCYDECEKRKGLFPDMYAKAHKEVMKECGY